MNNEQEKNQQALMGYLTTLKAKEKDIISTYERLIKRAYGKIKINFCEGDEKNILFTSEINSKDSYCNIVLNYNYCLEDGILLKILNNAIDEVEIDEEIKKKGHSQKHMFKKITEKLTDKMIEELQKDRPTQKRSLQIITSTTARIHKFEEE